MNSIDLRQHKVTVVSWSVEVLAARRLRWTLGLECGHTVEREGPGCEVENHGQMHTDGRQFTWRPVKVSCEVCTGKRAAPSC